MSKLTQEQKDALEELHSAYKNAERTAEHAIQDVHTVWNEISMADDNADNELLYDLSMDLQNLAQEVDEYEEELMSTDKVEYFYNRIDEIANSYEFSILL